MPSRDAPAPVAPQRLKLLFTQARAASGAEAGLRSAQLVEQLTAANAVLLELSPDRRTVRIWNGASRPC